MVLETAISKYFVHKTGLYWSDESYGDEMASVRYQMTLIATVMKHVTTSPLMNSHQLTSPTSPATSVQ